jgi:hypothetical protein
LGTNHNFQYDSLNKFECLNNFFSNELLSFTQNNGQIENKNILFYNRYNNVYFVNNGIIIELRNELKKSYDMKLGTSLPTMKNESIKLNQGFSYFIKQEFIGANPIRPIGGNKCNWSANFYYGNDSMNWFVGVPNYKELYYENIYDGIDLKYYYKGNSLKYDFIVHPGSNINDIKIRYNGIKRIEIDNEGNLIMKSSFGDLIDRDLIIYQLDNGQIKQVKGKYELYGRNEYGFTILDKYDPNKDLIIDPYLEYSTYIGGYNEDIGSKIITDSKKNILVTGGTASTIFPVINGTFDTTYNGGESDVFITKFDPSGTKMIFSTYIGGNSSEEGLDIRIDSLDNIVIVGMTNSSDFPVTNNSFDTQYNKYWDLFALKLNNNGSKLLFSSFIGGNKSDHPRKFILDKNDNLYICGHTNSIDFPTTSEAYNSTKNNESDTFFLKLSSNGSALIYSTYIGGNSWDESYDIDIDSNKNIIIVGYTNSSDFPITTGVYQEKFYGGSDIFILRFNFTQNTINFSTYIGGSDFDVCWGFTLDNSNNIVLAGYSSSIDYPTTMNSFNNSYNGSYTTTIISILNSNGSKLLYSTFIGGNNDDIGVDVALDSYGNVIVTGWTSSSDFPTSNKAFDTTFNGSGGWWGGDLFLIKLNHNLSELQYSTYIGGNGLDICNGMYIDGVNSIYITGYTDSSDFPTTPNAFQQKRNYPWDIFILKFSFKDVFEIRGLSIFEKNNLTSIIYAKYCIYNIKINVTNTISLSDTKSVQLFLDSNGFNISLEWNRILNKFHKMNDPNNNIILESSSNANNDSWKSWIINFNVTFKWTFPEDDYIDFKVKAISKTQSPSWLNVTNSYRIENDLMFYGDLAVRNEDNFRINNSNIIRGSECLNWSGQMVVYEGTTDVYPPADEFDVTLWDEQGNYLLDSPSEGEEFNFQTITPNFTDLDGYTYTINLTGIPPDCDKTNTTFSIRIDGDNLTFSNPRPEENEWQTKSDVFTGIIITDHGGGVVDNKSVKYSISNNNGDTWEEWNSLDDLDSMQSIVAQDFITFEDGDDNLIKWQASDSVGNGPVESKAYRILVDTHNVTFSNASPLDIDISSTSEIKVGITISDHTSGVNASKIQYSISLNDGNNWDSWRTVDGYLNNKSVDVKLNLSFPNSTGNRIRWRAYDVAGNGPAYSDEYVINVNIPKPPIIPEIKLISPANNSKLTTTSVEVSWEIVENYHPKIVFDIKLDTTNPPQNVIEQDYTDTKLIVDDLENGQTYYWTVIPRLNNINGTCLSNIWSFTVDIPLPRAILKTPANNSEISSTLPTLVWLLENDGSEEIAFDVYFGPSKDPPLKYEELSTTYFAIDTALQDNLTYYWKVVPWIGEHEGFGSEIWSFTVKLKYDKIPEFGIKLILNQNPLEIKPGEVKFVSAIVTNLGEQNDNFTLVIGDINNSKITAENYRQDTMEIGPGKNKEFLIMISVEENTKPGFENITITAKSKMAEQYYLEIQDKQILTINILEKDDQDGKERGQPISIFYFSILLIIVILIIISIILMILIRKKSLKKDNADIEIQDIIPETSPGSITIPKPETTIKPAPVSTQQQDETLEE